MVVARRDASGEPTDGGAMTATLPFCNRRTLVVALIRMLILASLLGAGPFPTTASAQIAPHSGCADCHFADLRSPRRDHLESWDRSPHGRSDVGCEKCHRGNPRTFEAFLAHAGILRPSDPKSPVNRRNLPSTCGTCHVGPVVAFEDSKHYELLKSGDQKGPTCSTCHGDVDGRVLSAKALASQCSDCHGPNEVAPRAERVRHVREQYEGLAAVREQMKLAKSLIKRVDDKKRRAVVTQAYELAEVPLKRAVDAGHRFEYGELREYLAVAQTRAGALLSNLSNR